MAHLRPVYSQVTPPPSPTTHSPKYRDKDLRKYKRRKYSFCYSDEDEDDEETSSASSGSAPNSPNPLTRQRLSMNASVRTQLEVHANENPDDAILHILVGERCLGLGDEANALKHFGRAVKLGVKTQKIYTHLGETHMKLARNRFSDVVPSSTEGKHLQKAHLFLNKAIRASTKSGNESTVNGGGRNARMLHESLALLFLSGSYDGVISIVSNIIDYFPHYEKLGEVVFIGAQSLFCVNRRGPVDDRHQNLPIEYLHSILENPHAPYDEVDVALLTSLLQRSVNHDSAAAKAGIEFAFFRRRAECIRVRKRRYEYSSSDQFGNDNDVWNSLGLKCMEKGDTVFAALAFAECLRCYDHQDDWPAEILYHLGKMYFHMNEKYSAYTSMLAAYKRNCYHIKTRACLLAWDPESWKNLFEVQDRAIVKMQGLVRGHVIRLWDKFFRASRGIQARMRMMLKRNRYRKWRTSAILIEATWRGYAVRVGKDLETILRFKATCLIQRIWRGFIARRRVLEIRYKRMEGVVIYVQCVARRFIAQAKVRRWHLGATKLQSLWRMHITRLYLFSIGILPLVRWVQIGASFIPLPMVRRDANWEVGKGKMWLGKIESVTKALDLTVKGLSLKANIRPVTYYNAVIAHRVQLATDDMKATVKRVERHALKNSMQAIESIRRQIQKEDDYAAYRAARERDTETYLKNLATLENAQTTAMSLLDRSRRRIASSTPRWLQKIAAAINDLKQHGHQPLTMWRARLQLHIEATVFALVEVHGDNQIAVGLKALSSNINRLSANQLRSELYTVLKEGEQFETKRSRDFRSLVAEFRAARRKAKRATKRIHELKTRLAALNKENELSISLLKTKYSQNEDEESSAAASPPALPSLRNKIQLQPLSPPFSQPGTVGAGSAVDSNTHAITAEGKLLERCRQLGSMLRTREDEDSLSGEYKRLLAQCCNLGSWQVALKCHAYMAELKLPRDRQAYTQVLICLKKSPEHPYPHEIAFATLEEMEHLGMCEKSVTPYLLVMDGIAISESRVDPKKRSSLWRQALRVLSKLREKGHKATTAVHEVLARCCVRGSPEQVYEGLKWAGIPEYLCYSIAQKALSSLPG